jgi:hypothetical protein
VSQELFYNYLSVIKHPYQQVRSVLASNLNACCQTMWIPSIPSAIEAIIMNLSNRGGAFREGIADDAPDMLGDVQIKLVWPAKEAMDGLIVKFAEWRVLAKDEVGTAAGPSAFAQAGKTGNLRFMLMSSFILDAGVYQQSSSCRNVPICVLLFTPPASAA